MIQVRRSEERGHANHGWLDTRHTFSFADYYDPQFLGFRQLRVINEDIVQPGRGFGAHSHRDMEIITYVLEGRLEHRDSMGNSSAIRPGEVQRMSAGSGVTHSEFNPSHHASLHLLQIWILPDSPGLPPSYEQKDFTTERAGRLCLVASRHARNGSVRLHQDVDLYASVLPAGAHLEHVLPAGAHLEHVLAPNRHAWIQAAQGTLQVNGVRLEAGDGAAVANLGSLRIEATSSTEFLLFDLA